MIRREKVVISRYWNNPSITVKVTDDSISLEFSMDDFIAALLSEMKHPFVMMTRAQQETAIIEAKESVLLKVKEASAQAV